MRKFIINLLSKLLSKHRFTRTMVIHKPGSEDLYTVEALHYDINLEPLTIIKRYPEGKAVYSVGHKDSAEFKEYKKFIG